MSLAFLAWANAAHVPRYSIADDDATDSRRGARVLWEIQGVFTRVFSCLCYQIPRQEPTGASEKDC